jgi:predicted RNase H-like HicB family nuclease
MSKQSKNMSKITLIQELEKRLCKTSLSIVLYKQENYWVSECPELEVLSMGYSVPDSIQNISEAIWLFIDEGIKTGELKEWLIELGWKITDSKIEYNGMPKQLVELSKNEQTLKLHIEDILESKNIEHREYA